MADAQLMEEELQQSVMMSEQGAELEVHAADEDVEMGNETAPSATSQIDVGRETDGSENESMDDEHDNDEGHEDEDEDLDELEESSEGSEDEGDDGFDEDAEGEEGDEEHNSQEAQQEIPSVEDDHDDDEEDEGVGAVKIKPGETDSEDESDEASDSGSDAASDASLASISDLESEGDDAPWEDAAENAGEDDDESEIASRNNCIFCKQPEEKDPAESYEDYLACSRCGDNAHQLCARNNNAAPDPSNLENWRCPGCGNQASEEAAEYDDTSVNGHDHDNSISPASRRATAPKLARDLLPPQKVIKPDSHSVFNHLVLDEDPMDGSRVLRKRKTSSAEADENVMSLRKRRRNTGDEQSQDDMNGSDEPPRPQSARSLRIKITKPAAASIVSRGRNSLTVRFQVSGDKLGQILARKPRGGDKKRSRRPSGRSSRNDRSRSARAAALPAPPPPFTSASYSQPFYSFYDKETDELKGKPYGGILTEAEADTSKTMPTNDDRRRFDEAKQKAEEEWRQRLLKMQSEIDVPVKKSKKASGPASQIECIEFGGWEIDTWYAAPYPEEYSRNRVLYICEFCLKYMNSDYVAWRHKLKCPAKHPPGDEIYRHNSVSVFEVDGRKNPVYCQNLCLLAKLFLGSKTLYYDVEPFLFYVLCEYDEMGYHFVGYFSKEKRASSQNNVSCILTLPIHQRKGYGNLLIDFSYLLTRVEQKTGSPEKPLSDMGLVSYRNYWRLIMCRYLVDHCAETGANGEEKIGRKGLSIKKISDDTGLTPDDVISALEGLRCLVRDPQTQVYAFRVDLPYCKAYIAKWEAKNYVQLNPAALTWTPYVMGRSNATNFELGPALNAIAPREEDEPPKSVVAGESLPRVNGTGKGASTAAPGGDKQPDAPPTEAVAAEPDPKAAGDSGVVLESTELNETANVAQEGQGGEHMTSPPRTIGKPNGILVNGKPLPDDEDTDPKLSQTVAEEIVDQLNNDAENATSTNATQNWAARYRDIPPSRFEVVPPITGGNRRVDRIRAPAVPRPPAVRTNSSSRPRPKRSGGSGSSARRASSAASKPKPSGSKRKTGGTGRGPGRWPKGTKKSDYGNADSGPGFPPGWLDKAKAQGAEGGAGDGDAEKNSGEKGGKGANDTVQVQTPKGKESSSKDKGKDNLPADVPMADI